MLYLFAFYPFPFFIGLMLAIYTAYFAMTVVFYAIFLSLISERMKQDTALSLFLPFFPLYAFFIRVWSAIACLREFLCNEHLNSSMAPWWVLRKTKF
jgi:hypothetical protein